jgi:hypothetical protein
MAIYLEDSVKTFCMPSCLRWSLMSSVFLLHCVWMVRLTEAVWRNFPLQLFWYFLTELIFFWKTFFPKVRSAFIVSARWFVPSWKKNLSLQRSFQLLTSCWRHYINIKVVSNSIFIGTTNSRLFACKRETSLYCKGCRAQKISPKKVYT